MPPTACNIYTIVFGAASAHRAIHTALLLYIKFAFFFVCLADKRDPNAEKNPIPNILHQTAAPCQVFEAARCAVRKKIL